MYGVEKIRIAKVHVIADLLLLWISLVHELVVDFAPEVTIVLEKVGCHLCAHVGRHTGDGHRRSREGIEESLFQPFAIFVHESGIRP